MRSAYIASLLVGVSAAEHDATQGQYDPGYKTLFDVYGDPFALAAGQAPVATNRLAKGENYRALRLPNNCSFPLDVVIVQDATGSFADDYEQMRNTQLKAMTTALSASHPGSRFGLVSFKDRPIRTLGETFDYCHRYDLALQSDGFQPLYDAYGTLWSNGGQDPPENQFGAIIAALDSLEVGWQGGEGIATKLIVVSTDSWPHFAHDGLNLAAYNMGANSGVLDLDETNQCRYQYYPSPQQVRSAILSKEAYGAFLVFDGNYANGLPRRSWEWFNSFLGQEASFVEGLANDSSNFWEALGAVIKTVETQECNVQTTTATPPTDPASTEFTDVWVTPAGTTEPPTVPPPATCNCPAQSECKCPDVVIKLQHKPKELHLDITN